MNSFHEQTMKQHLVFLLAALVIPSSLFAQQFLPVKSIVNARELGGYTMPDGRTIRSGALIRAAHLADATEADIQYLSGLPVAQVIDFRLEREKMGKADKTVPGAQYIVLPIDASGNVAAQLSEKEKKKLARRKSFDLKKIIVLLAFNENAQQVARDMYHTLLFTPECQEQFARFFREVLEADGGTVLYHCTQGKDRTGVASALLLAALGASRETIVADFDATNRVYEKDVKKYTRRVKFWGGKEKEVGVVKAFMGVNTDNFVQALERIDREYGSLEAYLETVLGVTAEDRKLLQERYLR